MERVLCGDWMLVGEVVLVQEGILGVTVLVKSR